MLEDPAEVLQMLLQIRAKHQNVIQINCHESNPKHQTNVSCIKCWNVAGALNKPSGRTFHSNRPLGVTNAFLN